MQPLHALQPGQQPPAGDQKLAAAAAGQQRTHLRLRRRIVHDHENAPVPQPEALEQLLGLSPAEARMAAALAAGATVLQYARQAGVTRETARWRLKQIQAKTGAHTQVELVRRVLGSLPQLV